MQRESSRYVNCRTKKYVKEHFATKNTIEIAEFLQVPTREVSKYASNSRLKKSSKSLYQKKSICQASSELILQNYQLIVTSSLASSVS
jgi:hypothetical protein